eukprot:GHRR01002678.1.p1 GENE.GHRR01002678.1~~GHRR01002678.1.p1  ORF type:complete len:353 (+),score=142.73 GHRR01002678.1:191-1249(+)
MQGTLQLGRVIATSCNNRQRVGITSSSCRRRQPLLVCSKFSNPFEGMFGGKGDDADAARRAIERSFGGAGKGRQQPSPSGKPQPPQQKGTPSRAPDSGSGGFGNLSNLFKGWGEAATPAAGGGARSGFGGLGAGGGGGSGGGGWNWGGATGDEAGGSGGEKPIKQELQELFKGMWTMFWNAALFLAFADVLHRSLDWCCQIELLLLVGAPAQAFERVAVRFYAAIEWIEANMLGWKIPGEEDMMPVYKQLALYYPEEHAYTFDSYRYKMTEPEKQTLKRYYALRWWERDGGFAGDVTPAEVQAIKDKYNPNDADLRAYYAAKAQGRLAEYWAARTDKLKQLTGDSTPPTALA